MKSPSIPAPPPPPDPYVTSAANQAGNIGTADAQAALSYVNENSPFGSVRYDQTGTHAIKDAQGKELTVPTYTKTTQLSDAERVKYDLENQIAGQAGNIATAQLGRLDQTLSRPIENPAAGKDYNVYRDEALQAMRERMNPELDRQYEQGLTRLANQGVRPGSEAYREAVALADRSRNDAGLGMVLNAGQYAQQAQGMDQAALQSAMAIRNQPINEISALMGQSQVNVPQFQNIAAPTIAGTSVGDNIWRNYAAQQGNWQQQANMAMSNRNAMMGGLFGLGSSLVRLPFMMA